MKHLPITHRVYIIAIMNCLHELLKLNCVLIAFYVHLQWKIIIIIHRVKMTNKKKKTFIYLSFVRSKKKKINETKKSTSKSTCMLNDVSNGVREYTDIARFESIYVNICYA